jgi:predicted transcriptional regulator
MDSAMSFVFSPEIKRLIDQNMATGLYSSEEDVLQTALHVLNDYHATIADIRLGLVDYENGRGQSLSEAMADIRKELGAQQ